MATTHQQQQQQQQHTSRHHPKQHSIATFPGEEMGESSDHCDVGLSSSCPLHENGLEGFLMREQDADALESMNCTEANRTTPLLSARTQDESLLMSLSPLQATTTTNSIVSGGGTTAVLVAEESFSTDADTFLLQPPAQSTCESRSRDCNRSTTAHSSPAKTSRSGGKTSQQPQEPISLLSMALKDYDGSSPRMKRTDSKERRIHEAAQYEEAVGEPAPVCIIEDDEEDDDDDDEQQERQVEQIHVLSISKAQQKQQQQQHLITTRSYSPPHDTPRRRPRSVSVTEPRGSMILTQLPTSDTTQDFVYKGIHSNPPDIVNRGITRGNMAVLHRKAWLEVSDKYHRYGKHLRLYYRHWESIGFPTNQFFDWLDSKGEAAGCPLPEIAECPRSTLDSDTVLYITNPDVTEQYALTVVSESGRAYFRDPVGTPVITGETGWIFVFRDNRWYGAPKITSVSGCSKQRFHHSSFFGGKAVAAAGIFITDESGRLIKLYPHSGHYRPGEAHMQRVLFFLYHMHIDLRTFDIDTQQIEHVARDATGTKVSKLESLHLHSAITVALFLAHKAKCIRCGLFQSIHHILKLDVSSVSGILASIQSQLY